MEDSFANIQRMKAALLALACCHISYNMLQLLCKRSQDELNKIIDSFHNIYPAIFAVFQPTMLVICPMS